MPIFGMPEGTLAIGRSMLRGVDMRDKHASNGVAYQFPTPRRSYTNSCTAAH